MRLQALRSTGDILVLVSQECESCELEMALTQGVPTPNCRVTEECINCSVHKQTDEGFSSVIFSPNGNFSRTFMQKKIKIFCVPKDKKMHPWV